MIRFGNNPVCAIIFVTCDIDKAQIVTHKMIKLRYDPYYGNRVLYYPESRYYHDDTFGRYWSPKFAFSRLPRYWPIYMIDLWPTEHHMRQIRLNIVKSTYKTWSKVFLLSNNSITSVITMTLKIRK
ncbi:unnamed protein product [Acanthoscelides obtectus]|uniref:Uncharacterized protein n=1 Tax=Acanthoscelides obtectus TaxID=200917 RepID=A0A9P0KGR0_ACAOB|nr:unnamed protein product [Acanthoscelides obtectus]CAK1681658.1 hypothetical protein AOBTE_LOCUS33196 [Acanthoscelides obtectus]